MSGSNKLLQANQVLFRAGDASDGMYLIRKGELRVYLEQDGKEVSLATVGAGGMIGEMALFDGAPRSASVKAVSESEVTHITTDDFGKLMKQIPKWFVGLMSALSNRLRQTNERLQKLENGGTLAKGKPYQSTIRMLNVLNLLWHKDGEKDGKDWNLQKQAVEGILTKTFGEDPQKIRLLLEVIINQKLFAQKQDSYKNIVLTAPHRAILGPISTFVTTWVTANPATPCLSDGAIGMLRVLESITMKSPYDALTVSLRDLLKEGKGLGYNVSGWDQAVAQLASGGEEVKVVKTSTGVGLRTTKKDVATYLRHHEILAALYKANLAS